MIDCLSRERLLAYLDATVRADEESHILTCPRCQGAAEALTDSFDEALVANVRQAVREPAYVAIEIERAIGLAIRQGARADLPNTGTFSTGDFKQAAATATVDAPRNTDLAAPPAPSCELTFLSPPQGPDELGRLGKYRVLKELGHGGMGVVLLAEDERLGRQVALKVMRPQIVTAKSRERFLREARAAAQVEHERVVPVYEADEVNGVLYLAMRLLPGESLQDRLRRPGLTLAEAVRIGRETAEGLAAAHLRGLIHRDIKPANLWLEATEHGWHMRVLDFGLARLHSGDTPLTQPGTVMGTPAYMAPEQARGDEVDGRGDLFSLGCVLYQVMTGVSPFHARDTLAVLRRLELHVPDAPRTLNPAVPEALSDLVMRLLAKDRECRPGTASEVVATLHQIDRDLSLAAQAETRLRGAADACVAPPGASAPGATAPVTPARLRLSRRKVLVGAGAALVCTVTALAVLSRPTPKPTDPDTVGSRINLPALKGGIDVLVYEEGNPRRQNLFLDDPGAMPLRPGDQFSIEAEVNREAYLYVLWIDTNGKVLPVYPWRPGHWEERPATERPLTKLRRPEAVDEFYLVSKGTAGMDTLVLLARQTPLPPDVDLSSALGALPRPAAQELKATVWFENGVAARNRRGREGMFDVTRRNDPVLMTQQRIREKLKEHFEYTLAVSFANQGR